MKRRDSNLFIPIITMLEAGADIDPGKEQLYIPLAHAASNEYGETTHYTAAKVGREDVGFLLGVLMFNCEQMRVRLR
jgi:hypothetical protein